MYFSVNFLSFVNISQSSFSSWNSSHPRSLCPPEFCFVFVFNSSSLFSCSSFQVSFPLHLNFLTSLMNGLVSFLLFHLSRLFLFLFFFLSNSLLVFCFVIFFYTQINISVLLFFSLIFVFHFSLLSFPLDCFHFHLPPPGFVFLGSLHSFFLSLCFFIMCFLVFIVLLSYNFLSLLLAGVLSRP